jgi:two-component system LytT family sensor kinase
MQRKVLENILLPLALMFIFIASEVTALVNAGISITTKGYITYLLEIATFYSNLLVVAPVFFIKRRLVLFIGRLVVLIVIYHLLRCWLTFTYTASRPFWQYIFSGDRIVLTIWRLDYALGFSFFIVVLKALERKKLEKQRIQLELLQAKEEKARAENTLVQMQLNPHTLHNALSYLEAQCRKYSPQMTEAIVLISEVLEPLMINTQTVEKVPVSRSLSQIDNLIALQRLIHNNSQSLRATSKVELGDDELLLPPSLLMPVIENLFKYGKLNDPESPATIDIKIDSGTLHLNTWNQKKRKTFPGNGVGLDSVRYILNYYYPGKHSLTTVDKDTDYTVSLTIQL